MSEIQINPPLPAVDRSVTALVGDDVIFMYPATDPATYARYGCTFLAWGGAAKGESVRQLESMGVHGTGSLWCLTAGAENLHKNADLRDAVCRDITGAPIPVWWLFDCTYEGTPTWFGCTNHPAFRAFVRQRVAEEMRGGAPGLHVDDHLGTAHSVAFLGGCFCDHCMAAFRTWLKENGTSDMLATAGATTWDEFDYRTLIRQHAADDAAYKANIESMPLRNEFLDCQLQLAAENVRQLGQLAADIVQRPITLSANAALPELPHLAVAPNLTHLVGEVPHQAHLGTASLHEAVYAYRMAEATGKPLAATARGQDWAWVLAKGAVNLAKIWIALGYCAGQRLMAPHRQWCFTLEKGSHWYDGPAEEYAPLYQFVRAHPQLFRGTCTVGPLAIANAAPRPLARHADRQALVAALGDPHTKPTTSGRVWQFPRRTADGRLIVHLLNLDYEAACDHINAARNVRVQLPAEWATFGDAATIYTYDADAVQLSVDHTDGVRSVIVPELKVWSIVAFDGRCRL
ncbi:MAG: Alpha-agarase [Phycisphaerales bacterium]|nr:Alpha-agarase [Phycisphaerales bacterium]